MGLNNWLTKFAVRSMALSETDRIRLHKLVGMLGSAHDGERASAAGFIERLAKSNKMSLDELMVAGFGSRAAPGEAPRPPAYDYAAEMRASQRRRQGQWHGFSQPHYKRPPAPEAPPEPVPVLPMGWHDDLRRASSCKKLSRWDREFSRDVAERYSHRYQLSDAQTIAIAKVLERFRAAR